MLVYFKYKHDYNLAYPLAKELESLNTNIDNDNFDIYINNQDNIMKDELITYLFEKQANKKV